MPPRKTKVIVIKLTPENLSKFPELPTSLKTINKIKPKPKTSLKLKLNDNNTLVNNLKGDTLIKKSFSVEPSATPSSAGNGEASSPVPGTPVLNATNSTNYKSTPYVRSGVGGLMMNPQITRSVDKSGRRVSSWAKYDDDFEKRNIPFHLDSQLQNTQSNETTKESPFKGVIDTGKNIEVDSLGKTHKMISFKDVRNYKEHEDKDIQNNLIEEAKKRSHRVVRSFSGYLMVWPTWHKIKEGELNTNEKLKDLQNEEEVEKIKDTEEVVSAEGSKEIEPLEENIKFES